MKRSCLSPIWIKNPDAGSLERYIPVPCGSCVVCRKKRAFGWFLRLKEELKDSDTCIFVTLTYNEDNIRYNEAGFASVWLDDYQRFLKRLRKNYSVWLDKNCVTSKNIRYYGISEYGGTTYRPHYHFILYNINISALDNSLLERSWQSGFVSWSLVSDARLRYVSNYHVSKYISPPGANKTFTTCSRNPGIGYRFTDRAKGYYGDKRRTWYNLHGRKVALPRYYKDKFDIKNGDFKLYAKKQQLKEKQYFSRTSQDAELLKREESLVYSKRQELHYKLNKKNI